MTDSAPIATAGRLAAPLLSRLAAVRHLSGVRWMARCPAHEDRSPSLSIREDADKVLLHCFSGCDPEDVLAAVGLTWRDLYPDPLLAARNRPNEAAGRYAKRTLAALDPIEFELGIVRLVAADVRAGKAIPAEDRARAALAVERLRAAGVEV